MFVNKDSIIIDGTSMGKYITKAKYGYHKLWSNDSGRALSGKQSGTLVGIFPKLTLSFKRLNEEELELLEPTFDNARQSTSYMDPRKKAMYTMETYTGDWEIEYKNIGPGEPFTLSFIATDRRR